MFDLLFIRTFSIVGGMLLTTALFATFNKESMNGIANVFVTLGLMAAFVYFRDSYPTNLVLLALISAWFGWMIGPLVSFAEGSVVTQALACTALATLGTGMLGFFSGMDFGFLKGYLAVALFMLVAFSLLNAFWMKFPIAELVFPYLGSMIFVLYLVYDFSRLRHAEGDSSWGTAADIALSLYLDIVNLFLQLMKMFFDSGGHH